MNERIAEVYRCGSIVVFTNSDNPNEMRASVRLTVFVRRSRPALRNSSWQFWNDDDRLMRVSPGSAVHDRGGTPRL